ncbi:ABC transporter ATP-binding protein [Caballeronia sp. LZ008]|uniref:ABC transporter ATP-binding protein n=1 Tax=unclassified Caballeronia TaxID=2646786 RepID=UPI0020284DBC|nr:MULTISPECIES: ABC transporter ATP-binding protein [unclassified Caballeronia]MDR5798139.1 ABC transporter ATP-binding protein [Caballeronia sp. LZ008]
MSYMLEVKGLSKRFGGLVASSNINFSVETGEIFGVIGPNGAGKTTLFNVIAGHYRPSAGSIVFEGREISGRTSNQIGRIGIARTFQAVHLFRSESVAENLRRAAVISRRHSPLAYFTASSEGIQAKLDAVSQFLGFEGFLRSVAGSLPYGHQKMLGVGMALMTSPKLLLMDEPVAGLNPSEKKEAASTIRRIRDELGVTILLVEHDMPLVMGICDRIMVINQGKPLALGCPETIKSDASVIEAYLGEDYEFA